MCFAEKISFEIQRKCIQKLCEISNALWKPDMKPRPDMDFTKS